MSEMEKPVLRSANDNPWYCLATVHGEQPLDAYDKELAAKNREGWNRWMVAALSEEVRADALKNDFPADHLVSFSPEEKNAFCLAFARRTGRENEQPPDPRDDPDFSFTNFDRNVTFGLFLFRHASFRSATFSGRANFRSARFSGNADFPAATFASDTDFSWTTFSGHADFSRTMFSGNVNFRSATLCSFTHFPRATFTGNAEFHSTTFDSADFRWSTFSLSADFTAATFSHADFRSAIFSGIVSFSSYFSSGDPRAAGLGDDVFRTPTFSGPAYFNSAKFTSGADFGRATFSDVADFRSATFSDDAIFSSATFSGQLIFIDTKFASRTDFSGAKFPASVPDLRGATMHEATEWHGASWPNSPRDRVEAQKQIYAYERLKQEMEGLKKHEDEQSFSERSCARVAGSHDRCRARGF